MSRRMRISTLALMAALLLGGAAAAKPAPVAPAAQAFRLGGLQVLALRDADNVLDNDGAVIGVGVGPAAVAQVLRAHGAPTDRIVLSVDALLVKAPGRIMLFDTGLGPSVHGVLLDSLKQAGVTPEAVTDVFITHAHGDHVGGLVAADGRPASPRAVVHLSAREWAWMQAQPGDQATAKAVAAQVRTFEPGTRLAPGVKAVELYGHTPGHVGYEIASQGHVLFDAGDLAHSAVVSLAEPGWAIEYDTDRKAGAVVRSATLARLAASRQLVFLPHFPFPGVGRIVKAGEGYRWRPAAPGEL